MIRTMQMFKPLLASAAVLVALTVSAPAFAQSDDYQVKISNVSDSCQSEHTRLPGKVDIRVARDARAIQLRIPGLPALRGKMRKRGKFKVEGAVKQANKTGHKGKFSATGRIGQGAIRLVLVAEIYKDGKAQCTQSWNVAGNRR